MGIRGESTEVPQSYAAELKIACKWISWCSTPQITNLATVVLTDIRNLTAASFEPPLPDDSRQIVPEGSLFQLTCLEPRSLPLAKKYWLNPLGHTVSCLFTKKVCPENKDYRYLLVIFTC